MTSRTRQAISSSRPSLHVCQYIDERERLCGLLFLGPGSRCEIHKMLGQSYSDRIANQQLVGEWVQRVGWWCPGWHRPAHAVKPGDLTVEHVVPVSRGGRHMQRTIRCRSCNSARKTAPL